MKKRLIQNIRRSQGLLGILFFLTASVSFVLWRFGMNNIHAYIEYTPSFGRFCLIQAVLVVLTGTVSCAAAQNGWRSFAAFVTCAALLCWVPLFYHQFPRLHELARDGWLPVQTASKLRTLLALNLSVILLCAAILLLRGVLHSVRMQKQHKDFST